MEFAHLISDLDAYGVESAIFDMWALSKSRFFVGSWHSTLTRTVCHWRGYDRMYTGTNCYLTYKWKKVLETGNVSWLDIGQLTEPRLSWQKGEAHD